MPGLTLWSITCYDRGDHGDLEFCLYSLSILESFHFFGASFSRFVVNFFGSARDRIGDAGFIIQGSSLDIINMGGFHLLDPTVSLAELCAAWTSARYACQYSIVDHLIIEGDFAMVISRIRKATYSLPSYPPNPLIRDIVLWLRGYSSTMSDMFTGRQI